MPEDQRSWADLKTNFTEEYQDYKDDTKQANTSSYKANQLLQDNKTQVMTQIKGKAFKDEENIKEMHSQSNYLMCQAVRCDDEVAELKKLMKDLQKMTTKPAVSFEPKKIGGNRK